MPVARLKDSSTSDAMKSEDGNDSLDSFIRQAIGKEPFLSFSRAGESPVQWIQLLHALDQQDLPGWPLLSPLKVQMQKCEKCSKEFCSPINYRRHIRVHRRTLNIDKDSTKNRNLLGAFWDKLSVDEAKEVVSFKNVSLEEVSGSSIVRALTSFVRKPGFSSLPQVYMKAGSALLDIVQSRPSRFPISSQDLFSILDDASEKTFLCAGTAESMQKYVFDGEAGKIGLEMKNLVACTCFLVEQKLVKAWLADKDAEALRCHKLLVEEEEAAQKRQAELLERRRQKKLRQKEQKAKEQTNGEKTDSKEDITNMSEVVPTAEISSHVATTVCETATQSYAISPSVEPIELSNTEKDSANTTAQSGIGAGYSEAGTSQNVERRVAQGVGCRHLIKMRRQVPKSQRGAPNGFHADQNPQISKFGAIQKHATHRDPRAVPVVNNNKVWTRKPKSENEGESLKSRLQREVLNQPDQNMNCEVMIGSISVTLGNSSDQLQGENLVVARDSCTSQHPMPKKTYIQEKPIKPDSVSMKPDPAQSGTNRSTVKLWRPVNRQETGGSMPVQSGNRESEAGVATEKGNDLTLSDESCIRSCAMDINSSTGVNNFASQMKERPSVGGFQFSSCAAEAFLAQRWKEAIASDHVKLVIFPESEPPGCTEPASDNLVKTQNNLANAGALESSTSATVKVKFRPMSEKGIKLKYIPKKRTNT